MKHKALASATDVSPQPFFIHHHNPNRKGGVPSTPAVRHW